MHAFHLEPASSWDTLILSVHGCALALLLVLGLISLRADRRSLGWASAGVLGAAVAVGYLVFGLPPSQIPGTWITLLSEGTGGRNVNYTYGVGLHAGPAFTALIRGFAAEGVLPLRVLVHANLCLAAINVGLFFGIARSLLRNAALALVFTLALVVNLSFVNSAMSELPSQLLMLYFLAGVVALNAVANGPTYARWARAAGFALLAWASLAAALTRVETVLMSAPAMLAGVLVARRSTDELQAMGARAYAWIGQQLRRPWWQLAGLVVAGSLAQNLLLRGWIGRGAIPLGLAAASLPIFFGQVLPLSVLVLFILGTVRALRAPSTWSIIPLGIFWLFSLYHTASHRVLFELVRYSSSLLAAIAVVALLGWLELASWAERSAQPRQWRARALVALGVLSLVQPHRTEHGLGGVTERGLVGLRIHNDQQVDVQALVSAIEASPTCAVVTKVFASDHASSDQEYTYLLIGAAGDRVGAAAPARLGLEAALAQWEPAAPCVVFYQGLDCNRLGASCTEETLDAHQLTHLTYASRPYSDAAEYGEHRGTIELGSYRLR